MNSCTDGVWVLVYGGLGNSVIACMAYHGNIIPSPSVQSISKGEGVCLGEHDFRHRAWMASWINKGGSGHYIQKLSIAGIGCGSPASSHGWNWLMLWPRTERSNQWKGQSLEWSNYKKLSNSFVKKTESNAIYTAMSIHWNYSRPSGSWPGSTAACIHHPIEQQYHSPSPDKSHHSPH